MSVSITPLSADHILKGAQPPDLWIQEAIYGHRLTQEQKPFMLVLEALAICRGRSLEGEQMFPGLPNHPAHEEMTSFRISQKALRFLIFWRALDDARDSRTLTADQRFEEMIRKLEQDTPKAVAAPSFDYLKDRVEGDPDALLQAVQIIRGTELDPENDKRPQSRFLNPQGPSLHLTELNNKMTSNDRRFFSRGGELVYLMLNRSKHRCALADAIEERLLSDGDPIDQIARRLLPDPTDETRTSAKVGYLPLPWMKAYDRLAEDWLSVLGQRSLPRSQLIAPLASITALGVVRYCAEVGEHRFGIRAKSIPLDMSDGVLTDIRDLGKRMLNQHREAIRQSTAIFIERELENSVEWTDGIEHPHPEKVERSAQARRALEAAFETEFKDENSQYHEPSAWKDILVERSKTRKHGDPATVLQPLARHGGFAVSRPGVGTWFASSDDFLSALVHATVGETPVELEEFAGNLFARYGLIIGPSEADQHLSGMSIDLTSFRRNFHYLEERLAGLGLLKRLSDDCAFVQNPFARDAQ